MPFKIKNDKLIYDKNYARKHRQIAMERIRKQRVQAIEYLGGKCSKCGYDKCIAALEFHHPNNNGGKEKWSNRVFGKKWEYVVKAISECILLCANCHRELHHPTRLHPDIEDNRKIYKEVIT